MNLQKSLTDRRHMNSMTQRQVAEAIGISDKAYSKIETGVNRISPDNVKALCDTLSIPYVRGLQMAGCIDSGTEYGNLHDTKILYDIVENAMSTVLDGLADVDWKSTLGRCLVSCNNMSPMPYQKSSYHSTM